MHASIAAEPVSPEVAPKTTAVLLFLVSTSLKNAAANWSPKSLKDIILKLIITKESGIILKVGLIQKILISLDGK